MGTEDTFLEGKGHEAYNSSPSSAEVKNAGGIPPLPHMSLYDSAWLMKRMTTLQYPDFEESTVTYYHENDGRKFL
jgi:hypothetical protein